MNLEATQTVVLLESPQTKRTGFVTRPQLKLSYPLTGNLSIYGAGALNIGPNITSNQSQLIPAGGFSPKNIYEATQLTTGTRANQTVETRYQTFAVNAGFSWSFGPASNSRHLKGKITRPGDGGMRSSAIVPAPVVSTEPSNAQATTGDQRTYTAGHKVETSALVAGSPIGGIVVSGGKKPGGNMISIVANDNGEFELNGLEAGNYKFTLTAPEEPAGKSINEKGIKRSEDTRSERLSMTPTTTKQTQGANFGEKVAGGLQSGAGALSQGASKSINEKGISSTKGRPKNMVFSPGNPIGGLIVKGGKNPGGSMMVITTNNKGEFELNGIEAGDYRFMITAPEPSNAQVTSDEQRTYTAGHKMETSALTAGNPIGGLIVKGGKNPGGSMMTITTNDNGQIELKGLEAGDYKFTVTAPEQSAGKSINEKGISSTKGRPKNMVFSPGNPIGGLIVKGGKNPGGNMMVITTNDKGEFELKAIEAGDYKFTVIAPEQPAKGHSEKGIK